MLSLAVLFGLSDFFALSCDSCRSKMDTERITLATLSENAWKISASSLSL